MSIRFLDFRSNESYVKWNLGNIHALLNSNNIEVAEKIFFVVENSVYLEQSKNFQYTEKKELLNQKYRRY